MGDTDTTATMHRLPDAQPAAKRRTLLGGAGLALGATLTLPRGPLTRTARAQPTASGATARPIDSTVHRRAWQVREACARRSETIPIAPHPANDDETRYPNRIGSDTRGLPHNDRGEVDPAAYQVLLDACESGLPADFEKVPLGGTRRLGNPVGTLAVNFVGLDPTQIAIPPAPALASAARAADAVEVYWQALLRDVPFFEFQNDTANRAVLAACDELSRLSDFNGPKQGGRVTPSTLFRVNALYFDPADPKGRSVMPAGVEEGPVMSQFLLRDIPFGSQWISARIRPATPESEFVTSYEDWLRAQNGEPPRGQARFETTPRYVSNGRDLVRMGITSSIAMHLLLGTPGAADPRYGGMFQVSQPTVSPTNPYRRSRNQGPGGASFGPSHVQAVLAQGISQAPRSAYWQKWFVHRTLRPEAYGGLAHHRLANGVSDYPVHEEFLRSEALDRTRARQGTYLLSHTYPDGSPPFSAYPGGGAAVAGVTATLLKAWFDESLTISNPVQPDPRDPTRLIPYTGPPLTVGGELNKLASNYAMGRNWGGIHWRTDAAASLALAEQVAIAILRDERDAIREEFDSFTFTRFDGTRVTI